MRKRTPSINKMGGLNDAWYGVTEPLCPLYAAWYGMLSRCYSEITHGRQPSYVRCSVVPEWMTFSAFRSWAIAQDYKGKQLDKDLLVPGNSIYGPDTCLFVSSQINLLLAGKKGKLTDLPVGVSWVKRKSKYKATVCTYGTNIHLGYFNSIQEAEAAYLSKKAIYVHEIAAEVDCQKTKSALIRAAEALLKGTYSCASNTL